MSKQKIVDNPQTRTINPNTNKETLLILAKDPNPEIRQRVVLHPNSDQEVLEAVCFPLLKPSKREWLVMKCLADRTNNPQTLREIHEAARNQIDLLDDPAEERLPGIEAQLSIARNKATPPHVLESITDFFSRWCEYPPVFEMLRIIATRTDTPVKSLGDLAHCNLAGVVTANPSTPPELLKEIALDNVSFGVSARTLAAKRSGQSLTSIMEEQQRSEREKPGKIFASLFLVFLIAVLLCLWLAWPK